MRDRLEVLPNLKDWMVQMEIWDNPSNEAGAAGSTEPILSPSMDVAGGLAPSPDAKRVVQTPPSSAKGGAAGINNNFIKVANMPLCHLRKWLTLMEPVAFADAQLNSVCKHGRREESRELLAQLFEFVTGIPPNKLLFDDRSAEDAVMKFEATLKQLNTKMGRRARDLALPATWPDDGYYILVACSKQVLVQNRFTHSAAGRWI